MRSTCRRNSTLFLFALSLVWLSSSHSDSGQPTLARAVITINGKILDTEVAVTPGQRHDGLSFRKTLGQNSAMLFVYTEERKLLFTMRDASIPLSIAFIDNDLIINEILLMEPFENGPYPSRHPAKFALEVNQGWFNTNGIKVGDQVQFTLP